MIPDAPHPLPLCEGREAVFANMVRWFGRRFPDDPQGSRGGRHGRRTGHRQVRCDGACAGGLPSAAHLAQRERARIRRAANSFARRASAAAVPRPDSARRPEEGHRGGAVRVRDHRHSDQQRRGAAPHSVSRGDRGGVGPGHGHQSQGPLPPQPGGAPSHASSGERATSSTFVPQPRSRYPCT